MTSDQNLLDSRFDWSSHDKEKEYMPRRMVDHEAYNQMLSETMNPVLNGFKTVASFAEDVNDGCTTLASNIFGDDIAKQHSSELSAQAELCLARGHSAAAEHLMRRNLRFAVSSLGLDAEEAFAAAKQLKLLDSKLHFEPLKF